MKKLVLLFWFFISLSWAQESSSEFQKKLNDSYADSNKSPLTTEDLKVFSSLDFYPIDQKYVVEAQ